MAKKKDIYKKRYQPQIDKEDYISIGCDFNLLIEEYEKLRKFEYKFFLENLDTISVSFEPDNFLHLTGFNKISDATIVTLIDNEIISKAKFYALVKNKFVNYNSFNEVEILDDRIRRKANTKGLDISKIKLISETEHKSTLEDILQNRVPFFSQDNFEQLFGNKVVVDYNKDEALSEIVADWIFFKRIDNTNGLNVNLFVVDDKIVKGGHPVTFFREKVKDSFLYIAPNNALSTVGIPHKVLLKTIKAPQFEILYQLRENKHTKKVDSLMINWTNVRNKFKLEQEYTPQNELKSYFSSNHIKVSNLLREVNNIKEQEQTLESQIKEDSENCFFLEKIMDYENLTQAEQDDVFYYFYERNCDIFSTSLDFSSQYEKKSRGLLKSKTLIDKLAEKKALYLSYIEPIKKLEDIEIRFIYNNFFNTKLWSDNFIRELIDVYGLYENKISLYEIGTLLGVKPKLT